MRNRGIGDDYRGFERQMTDHPCLTCDIGWKDMTWSDGNVIHDCSENCEKIKEWREHGHGNEYETKAI
jgi:hypothetical protein